MDGAFGAELTWNGSGRLDRLIWVLVSQAPIRAHSDKLERGSPMEGLRLTRRSVARKMPARGAPRGSPPVGFDGLFAVCGGRRSIPVRTGNLGQNDACQPHLNGQNQDQ